MEEQEFPTQTTPPPPPAGRARLQQLHTFLVDEGTDVPEAYDTFEKSILEKPERLQQLHNYLVKDKTDVPQDYTLFEQKLTEGFDNYKKKVLSEPAAPLSGAGLPPSDTDFTQVPTIPSAPNSLSSGLDPATPALVEAQDYPDFLAAHPEQRAQLIEEEAKLLGEVPDGFERVAVPDIGPEEVGTYQVRNTSTGRRYIDRPLSKVAPGETEEQTTWEAAGRNFGNQLLTMVQGPLDYLGAVDRKLRATAAGQALDKAGGYIGLNDDPNRGNPFQEGADALEGQKAAVAPFHARSTFRTDNPATWPMATSNVAALAAPAIVSALFPEGKLASVVEAIAGVGFDGQMLEGSFERGRAAGLTGDQLDNFALADGAATMLVFKLGGAGLNAAGQRLVKTELMQQIGTQLSQAGGRLSEQEVGSLLAAASAKAGQVLKSAAREGGTMGTLMAASTVKDKAVDHAANQALGYAAFPEQSLGQDVADTAGAFGEGVIMGALPGGIRGLRRAPNGPAAQTAPAEATAPATQPTARYDVVRATGQVEMGNVEVIGYSPDGVQATVRTTDNAGNVQERVVPVASLRDKAGKPVAAPTSPVPADLTSIAEQSPAIPQAKPESPALVEQASEQMPTDEGFQAIAAKLDSQLLISASEPSAEQGLEPKSAGEGFQHLRWKPDNQYPDLEASVEDTPELRQAGTIPAEAKPEIPVSVAPGYSTPAENRAAGRFTKDGQTFERQAPLSARVARGNQAAAEFSTGVQQPVQYAVMEAADLQPSHTGGTQNLNHFLPEAQPKNRSAAFDPASQKAIADIAATPDLSRLGEAPNAYTGAPIVNGRGEALQGNGRGEGIRQHYRQGGVSYRRDVVAAAEKVGIPAEQTAGFREPVLVRIADVSDQRARELGNYTAADTESGGKRRLDARQATGRLTAEGRTTFTQLATPQGEATLTETIRGNAPELLRFLRKEGLVNETQLQTMAKPDGTLTPQGVEDITGLYRQQLFREGDPNLSELFAELPAAAQGGLDRAVGALLGVPEGASLVPEVQDAITGVREFRSSGTDFETWAGQADIFRDGQAPRSRYTPLTLKLINVLATEKRPTYIARLFQEYAAAVRGAGASLFGETLPKPRAEAVQETFGVTNDQPGTRPGNPSAAENPAGPDITNQRPTPPEPSAAPGAGAAAQPATEPAAANNAADGTGGPATAAANAQRRPDHLIKQEDQSADDGMQNPPISTSETVQKPGLPAPGSAIGGKVSDEAPYTGTPENDRTGAAGPQVYDLSALNGHLQAALARGDQAAAADYYAQAEKQAQQQAAHGPEAGRASAAFRLLAEQAPAAVVHSVEQDVAAQRSQAEAKLEKQAATEGRQMQQEKTEALTHALATPAVQAVRAQVAGKTKPTTPEQRATVRAERAGLLDELKQLAKNPGSTAYSSIVPITPATVRAAELHVAIFRTYISEGVLVAKDLVSRIRREAGPAVANATEGDLIRRATAALGDHRAAVRQGVAELGTTLDRIARDFISDADAVGTTLVQRFVDDAGLSPTEAQQYADAIRQEFDRRISAARQRRLDQLTKQAAKNPTKRASATDVAKTRELFALAPIDNMAILDHLRRTTDLPTLTPADAAHLRTLADAITAAPTGFQKDAAVAELLHATAQLKGIDWMEVGNAMWYANVLSGYKTHGVNLFANSVQTGAEALVHVAHALATGKGRYATATGKGLAQGLQRGAREAVSVLTTGRAVSRDGVKLEEPGLLEYRRFAGGAANPANYLKFVSRALRAGDVLFSTGLKEMRAYELAVKESLAEGQSGEPSEAVWARVNEKLYRTSQRVAEAQAQATAEGLTGNDYERRVFEIAEQSRDAQMREEAREYSTRSVFNGEVAGTLGWVTTGIQHITQGIDIAGFKPGKYVIPFTRVIANVANAALDYTPIGAARAGVSLTREQVGRGSGGHLFGGKATSEMQRQLTSEERGHLAIKSVFGAAAAVAAYALSHNQDEQGSPTIEISGAGTGNPTKDAQLRADGWQPYSIKAGGKWYSYASTPVGIMLAAIGNLTDGEKYRNEHVEKSDEALHAFFLNSFRALQFAQDMTAMKGTADFLAAADSKSADQLTRWVQRLAVGTVKGYVPWSSMLTQLAKDGERLAGQPRKQARTFGQMLVQDIPVASDGLNNAIDVLGDPLPIDTDRLISSAPYRDEATASVCDLLTRNNIFISVPNRNSGGAMVLRTHAGKETPMTEAEYFAFMQKRGQLLKAVLLHQLPELQKLPPEQVKKKVQQLVKRVSRDAKQQVFSNPGALASKK